MSIVKPSFDSICEQKQGDARVQGLTLTPQELVNDDPFLDARGAAAYLGLDRVVKHPAQTMRALCRRRRIQSAVVAGKIMIRKSWLEKYIRENTRKSTG